MGNSGANIFPMYFEVWVEETGERVIASSLIPVGMRVREVRLDVPLPMGIYDATCIIYQIGPDGEERGSVALAIALVVLS
jgi:hypothetical protein